MIPQHAQHKRLKREPMKLGGSPYSTEELNKIWQ
jgi:hypothetical protein